MGETERTRSLAILGTGSDVGKSIVTAGICRIFANNGVVVSPFKAQNMSNNSYPALLPDGSGYGEIGVAQAIQAQASRRVPRVEVRFL
jgi:adenosylcobyric acid synthase